MASPAGQATLYSSWLAPSSDICAHVYLALQAALKSAKESPQKRIVMTFLVAAIILSP